MSKKSRTIEEITFNEVSLVRRPAQEHAGIITKKEAPPLMNEQVTEFIEAIKGLGKNHLAAENEALKAQLAELQATLDVTKAANEELTAAQTTVKSDLEVLKASIAELTKASEGLAVSKQETERQYIVKSLTALAVDSPAVKALIDLASASEDETVKKDAMAALTALNAAKKQDQEAASGEAVQKSQPDLNTTAGVANYYFDKLSDTKKGAV